MRSQSRQEQSREEQASGIRAALCRLGAAPCILHLWAVHVCHSVLARPIHRLYP